MNQGVSFARNRGIDNSNGLLVAFLDPDDAWSERYLRTSGDLRMGTPSRRLLTAMRVLSDSRVKFTSYDLVLGTYTAEFIKAPEIAAVVGPTSLIDDQSRPINSDGLGPKKLAVIGFLLRLHKQPL